MKLSIVTPSLNQAAYLRLTLASVLAQRGDFQLQWIVADGGSTDGTLDLLAACDDPRLIWFSEPDAGQSDAINKALAKADGDVIGWLNSDDLYQPDALATVAGALTDHPEAQWLIGRCIIVDADGRPIRPWITAYKNRALDHYRYARLLRENFISQPAVFWRRSFLNSVGQLDRSLQWTMDYDLWLRMGQRCDPLIIPRTLAQFRLYPASKTGRVDRRQFDEEYAVACRYVGARTGIRWMHRLAVERTVWAYRLMRLFGQ